MGDLHKAVPLDHRRAGGDDRAGGEVDADLLE
jgi:hypothetical protein